MRSSHAHIRPCAGITGLERPDAEEEAGRSYGVLLSDTVVVVGGGSQPDMATASAPKDWNEVAYYLDQVRRRVHMYGSSVWEGRKRLDQRTLLE